MDHAGREGCGAGTLVPAGEHCVGLVFSWFLGLVALSFSCDFDLVPGGGVTSARSLRRHLDPSLLSPFSWARTDPEGPSPAPRSSLPRGARLGSLRCSALPTATSLLLQRPPKTGWPCPQVSALDRVTTRELHGWAELTGPGGPVGWALCPAVTTASRSSQACSSPGSHPLPWTVRFKVNLRRVAVVPLVGVEP